MIVVVAVLAFSLGFALGAAFLAFAIRDSDVEPLDDWGPS